MFMLHLVAAPVLCLFTSGCGINFPSPQTGNWVANLSLPGASSSLNAQASVALSGQFDSARGIARLTGFPCVSSNSPIPVTGTQNLSTLQTTWTAQLTPDVVLNMSSTQSKDLSTLNGTFSLTGSACGGLTSGDFEATRYSPLSGEYLGALVTTTGASLDLVASVGQSAAADANGQYPITGSATVAPDQCLSNPTLVNSYVLGKAFTNSYKSNDQSSLTLTGTYTPDATTMNLSSFSFTGGPCDGFSGAGTLMKHQ
jgi:hypothetical protein